MPRKSKITAIPVDQPVEEQPVEEVTITEAQEMTDVMNDIKAVAPEASAGKQPVVQESVDDAEPVADPVEQEPVAESKAKPKRASRAKAKAVATEPVVQVQESTLDEVVAEVELPGEVNKELYGTNKAAKQAIMVSATQRVACPDCGKEMSAKTLKYSHGANCLVKKKEAQEVKTERTETSINDEMLEELVQSRMNNVKKERLAKREKALEKLVAGALPS